MIGSPRSVLTTSRAAARIGPIPDIRELTKTLMGLALMRGVMCLGLSVRWVCLRNVVSLPARTLHLRRGRLFAFRLLV
jgi:hypothetical protein